MKQLLLTLVCLTGWAFVTNAQTPYWVKRPPVPTSGNFYYRVTVAEGKDYKDAYIESFAMAIFESYSKVAGFSVSISADQNDIKEGVSNAISSKNSQMRLPINKVCEYQEELVTSNGVKLYVLWQVANNALVDPQFEYFNNCE